MSDGDRVQMRAMAAVRAGLRSLHQARHLMTTRQFEMLLDLGQQTTVRDYSDRHGVPKPAVTRSADQLVERGLIERRADMRDRRSILMIRTRLGDHLVQSIISGAAAAQKAVQRASL